MAEFVTVISGSPVSDSPDLAVAKGLLDVAKQRGFTFARIAPGPDGPLLGIRETPGWRDEMFLAGFGEANSCSAIRRRRTALILPGGDPITAQLRGTALVVLYTVLCEWST